MNEHLDNVARAFSRKAAIYDDFGQDHPNLERMRARVRAHVERWLPPGGRILELNAGTGADAVYFARRGHPVHALDIAPGMVEETGRKAHQAGLEGQLTWEQRSFTDLAGLSQGPFDMVFSNMGGLNCTPDLKVIAQQLPLLLQPGGAVTWVLMPPFCLWELAALLWGDWRAAARRWGKGGKAANVEGIQFTAFYFTPSQVMRAFGPGFTLLELEGLSVFTPPADRKRFAHRLPRLYRVLVRLDNIFSTRWPFRAWGDFFILTMRLRDDK